MPDTSKRLRDLLLDLEPGELVFISKPKECLEHPGRYSVRIRVADLPYTQQLRPSLDKKTYAWAFDVNKPEEDLLDESAKLEDS